MPLIDFDKLSQEFETDDDFGFSAVSEAEYNSIVDKSVKDAVQTASEKTAEDYLTRLAAVEKIIIPFLSKLHSTGDKEYIYWPNRKPLIEKQIERILKLTRE
jgi:hypothetical protein